MSEAGILAAISAAAGITGVAVGSWIAARTQRRERWQRRIREQLDEFYGPMLALRGQIRARSELRRDVDELADEERSGQREQHDGREGREALGERGRGFQRELDYEDTQLREVLLPLYRQMREHFAAHMSLAEPSTRRNFHPLARYVEAWDHSSEKRFPGDTLRKITDRYGQMLGILYSDLEEQSDHLSSQLREWPTMRAAWSRARSATGAAWVRGRAAAREGVARVRLRMRRRNRSSD
jgi:hypothetical protein